LRRKNEKIRKELSKVDKPKFKKQMSELEEAKELRRAGRRNAWKK